MNLPALSSYAPSRAIYAFRFDALDKLARRERRGGWVDRMIRIDIYIYIYRFPIRLTDFRVGVHDFPCGDVAKLDLLAPRPLPLSIVFPLLF